MKTTRKDDLIFLHKFLKAIADALIKIFIPLYILKMTDDINIAMVYLVAYSTSVLMWMFIFDKFIKKYGFIAIIIQFIPLIIGEGVLSFCAINYLTAILVALLMGLSQAWYSVPLNLIFTFGDKKSNVGKFQIATNIGKVIFALISGFVLSSEIKNSFLIMAISSSAMYLLSSIPLIFAYQELKERYQEKQISTDKTPLKIDPLFILFHIFFGIFQPVIDNIIPLYLYINDLSFQSVTILIVLVELIKILMNYLGNFLVKKSLAKISILISGILFLVSSILIMIIKIPVVLYVFSCILSISFPLTFVPMFKLYCNYVRDTNNVIDGMMRRDYEIFSCRPAMYATSFVGLGLYPVLAIGCVALCAMVACEFKLLNKFSNKKTSDTLVH